MILPCQGEAHVFSRVVHATRDVVAIEINCTIVVDTEPIIALRKQLVLSVLENMVRIRGGGYNIEKSYQYRRTRL